MAETRMQFFARRRATLDRLRKGELLVRYRELGGLGGIHPPEKWRKDELVSSIVDMEWGRLPEGEKLPDPPHLTPPCDVCDLGQFALAHALGGSHHYAYTHAPEKKWVPESEAEAERLKRLERMHSAAVEWAAGKLEISPELVDTARARGIVDGAYPGGWKAFQQDTELADRLVDPDEQLPDNLVALVDELSQPIVSDDGVIVPAAMRPADEEG